MAIKLISKNVFDRCTLQDDFIILCPKFGTDKISGLNDH
jgi:hypothetical protein